MLQQLILLQLDQKLVCKTSVHVSLQTFYTSQYWTSSTFEITFSIIILHISGMLPKFDDESETEEDRRVARILRKSQQERHKLQYKLQALSSVKRLLDSAAKWLVIVEHSLATLIIFNFCWTLLLVYLWYYMMFGIFIHLDEILEFYYCRPDICLKLPAFILKAL